MRDLFWQNRERKADPFFGARRLWLAQSVSTPKCQASWSTWWLWQYSGDGRVAGVDSACDVIIYDGPIDQLVAEWSGGAPAPAPETQTITITITAPKDATINVVTA